MLARAALAAIASAVLLWLASPAVGIGWLAWVALVPAAACVLGSPGTRAARLAIPLAYAVYLELLLIPALPFGLAEGQWGEPAVPVLVDGSPVVAVALVAIPLVGLLLYAIRFGEPWGAGRLPARLAPVAIVAVPALVWTALDFVRANLDPGGLWGPLFLSQAGEEPAGIASIGGPWLVTLAIVAVNYALALALIRREARYAVAAAATAALLAVAGSVASPDPSAETLRVAAVQPGYDTAEEDRPELRRFEPGSWRLAALDLIADLAPLTRRAAGEGAELVVWPQASLYADPRDPPRVRAGIKELVKETGAAIVVPFFRPYPVREDYSVAALTAAGDGVRFTETRAKRRPLWFLGENGAHGEDGPLEVGGTEVGVLLGVDDQDPRNPAALANEGAELIVAPTHDWHQSATPQRAYAQLGAVAAARSVVRADWRYGSAVYSGDGDVLADAGSELRRTVVTATVSLGSGTTGYSRTGDVVAWTAIALAILAATRAAAPSSRSRAPRRAPIPRRPSPAPPREPSGASSPPP